MKRSSLVGILLLMICFTIGSLPALAGKAPTVKEQEEIRQSYQITAGGRLSLENINGQVTVKGWNEQRVEMVAIKSGPDRSQFSEVTIDVKATANEIIIDTVYPKGKKNINVGVSYELRVPRNINLDNIVTVNGSVEIADVDGTIETQTVNGSITIEGGNTVNAETVNGSIKATLLQMPTSKKVKFTTVNGSVNIFLADTINADIDAETVNGKINSELPITIQGDIHKKSLRGRLGSGGARLDLNTVNGSIHLNRIKAT